MFGMMEGLICSNYSLISPTLSLLGSSFLSSIETEMQTVDSLSCLLTTGEKDHDQHTNCHSFPSYSLFAQDVATSVPGEDKVGK
jgi:hypothetical protein